jgi:thiamine biosynthesis lipoprotein
MASMAATNRRRFLWLTASLSGACTCGGWWWRARDLDATADTSGERLSEPRLPGTLHRAERTSWALGSHVRMVALHRQADAARRALDAAFDRLALVESLMSIYRADSQVSRLNRDGVLDDPHPDLVQVLQYAQQLSQRSGGAFDVTVQPLWELYRTAQQQGRLPQPEQVQAAVQLVDYRQLEVSSQRVRLGRRGMAITLNGIAQGFAADCAMQALRDHGVCAALVDTGEIGTLGRKTDSQPWTVGIQHPRQHDAYLALAQLDGRCLATSGDYATPLSDDLRHHHLFDPRTGYSPTEFASVSVAAATAMEADALSTAVFVLGSAAGMQLLRQTPGVDALLVLKDGRTLATDGFPLEG